VSNDEFFLNNSVKNKYCAAFIPGLQDVIADIVKERLSDVKILKLFDGAILFETKTTYDKFNFFCFNNIFAVIDFSEDTHTEAQRNRENNEKGAILIKRYIKKILKEDIFTKDVISNNSKNFHTFRIVVSNENTPAAIDEKLRDEAEKLISCLSGLKVNRALPDTEFWFLRRSEGISLFMKRLTLRSSWEKTLHKGELPPPLAWTLCRLARLSHSDTVLDPFCGYGSIPEAAVKHFHITKFIACDSSREAYRYTEERFKKRKSAELTLYNEDFSKLPSLVKEKSVDAIVTDPPWGLFKQTGGGVLPEKMFDVFGKLLKDGGRAAVLYENNDSFLKKVPDNFKLKTNIPILLSGRKAVIYLLVNTVI